MKTLILIALSVLLSACNSQGGRDADGKILRDKNGCAFFVNPGAGDISYLRRMPDESASTCQLWHKDGS